MYVVISPNVMYLIWRALESDNWPSFSSSAMSGYWVLSGELICYLSPHQLHWTPRFCESAAAFWTLDPNEVLKEKSGKWTNQYLIHFGPWAIWIWHSQNEFSTFSKLYFVTVACSSLWGKKLLVYSLSYAMTPHSLTKTSHRRQLSYYSEAAAGQRSA